MQKIISSFVLFFAFISTALAQKSNRELVLQTFHSGYNVVDFDVDKNGSKLISLGDDKTLQLYDLSMRLTYKRILLPDSVKCEHLAIDTTGTYFSALEGAKIVMRKVADGNLFKEIALKPILDSLKLYQLDDLFFEKVEDKNMVLVCATQRNQYFSPVAIQALGFDLQSGKLTFVGPIVPLDDQINDIKFIDNQLFVLKSKKGLFVCDLISNKQEIVWVPSDGQSTAAMQVSNSFIWVLSNNALVQLNKRDYAQIRNFPIALTGNTTLKRKHSFTVDANENAYLYAESRNLTVFGKNGKVTLSNAPEAYLVNKMEYCKAKDYLLIGDDSMVSLIDCSSKKEVLKRDNSLTKLENWQFFQPGIAYISVPFQNAFLQVDFTQASITRQDFSDAEFTSNEQLIRLPKTKLVAASNGLYVKFLDSASNAFKYGISIPQKTFVSQSDNKLNYGSSIGFKKVAFTQDEKFMVSPRNLEAGILVWDLVHQKLLKEIAVTPLKKIDPAKKQIVGHLSLHPTLNRVYVETQDNYGGSHESLVLDLLTGNVIYQVSTDKSMSINGMKGVFFPKSNKIITKGQNYSETNVVNFDTNQTAVLPFSMTNPVITSDEKHVFFIDNDVIYSYEFETKIKQQLGTQVGVEELVLDPATQILVSTDRNNCTQIWDGKTGKLRASLYIQVPKQKTEQASYVFISPDFYYSSGGNYSNLILLRENEGMVPLEYFDRRYNRPDLLLKSIGLAKPELLNQLEKATARRLTQTNQTAFSDFKASIVNKATFPIQSAQANITIVGAPIKAKFPVTSYQLWLNGVAVYKERKSCQGVKTLSIPVALTEATNRIELAFWDEKGNESQHDFLTIGLSPAPISSLWLVGLGVSTYQDASYNLRFAKKDVENVVDFLKSAQTFKAVHVLNLSNEQVNIGAVAEVENFMSAAKPEDIVMVFYAGHGLLDNQMNYYLASYAMDFSNAATKGIPIQKLESALYASPGRKKLLMIDACHSGLVEEPLTLSTGKAETHVTQNQRGGGVVNVQQGSVSAEVLQNVFLNLNKGDGLTIISASGGAEFAFEDGAIGNGLFTYSFLEGIKSGKADLDKNKQISLSEIKGYVENRVFELSKGKQRPTNRRWNNYLDFPIWYEQDKVSQQMYRAAAENDTTQLRKFLNSGYAVNIADEDVKFSPLHYAARQNKALSIDFLLNNGADIEQKSSIGTTPLYLAVYNSHVEATYQLITRGAVVQNQVFYDKQKGSLSLAELAHQKNNVQIEELLLHAKNVYANHKTMLMLINLMQNNNLEGFKALIEKEHFDVNFLMADRGLSILYLAIGQQRKPFVDWLIQKGCSIKSIPYTQFEPLHLAAYTGNEAIMNVLLAAGADKGAKDKGGKVPADYVPADKPALKKMLQ
ncbi:ankyrin repeat domain-containing protein [Pedobacter sp. MW01-1-1]|uniref:ankyrin repeat domain-containing protein n=1 Tax=Pedobacter sp. MW01-1-1 TaxID=3383027 RepID=UPI003FF05D0C